MRSCEHRVHEFQCRDIDLGQYLYLSVSEWCVRFGVGFVSVSMHPLFKLLRRKLLLPSRHRQRDRIASEAWKLQLLQHNDHYNDHDHHYNNFYNNFYIVNLDIIDYQFDDNVHDNFNNYGCSNVNHNHNNYNHDNHNNNFNNDDRNFNNDDRNFNIHNNGWPWLWNLYVPMEWEWLGITVDLLYWNLYL